MASTKRDAAMRLVGQLQAAVQLIEMINVPNDNKRVGELKDFSQRILHKAMLAAWESAETQEAPRE